MSFGKVFECLCRNEQSGTADNDLYHGTEMNHDLSLHGNGGVSLINHFNANADKRPLVISLCIGQTSSTNDA